MWRNTIGWLCNVAYTVCASQLNSKYKIIEKSFFLGSIFFLRSLKQNLPIGPGLFFISISRCSHTWLRRFLIPPPCIFFTLLEGIKSSVNVNRTFFLVQIWVKFTLKKVRFTFTELFRGEKDIWGVGKVFIPD
jgi:hypothetical protein